MPLRLKATPATFEVVAGMKSTSFMLFDPNEIKEDHIVHRFGDCQMLFEQFVNRLPQGNWVASALWVGRQDKPPRGFKKASENREFYREIEGA